MQVVEEKCNIHVTSDPTNVSHGPELVIGVDIKEVFDDEGCTKIPSYGVDDILWSVEHLTVELIGVLDLKQKWISTHIENEQWPSGSSDARISGGK